MSSLWVFSHVDSACRCGPITGVLLPTHLIRGVAYPAVVQVLRVSRFRRRTLAHKAPRGSLKYNSQRFKRVPRRSSAVGSLTRSTPSHHRLRRPACAFSLTLASVRSSVARTEALIGKVQQEKYTADARMDRKGERVVKTNPPSSAQCSPCVVSRLARLSSATALLVPRARSPVRAPASFTVACSCWSDAVSFGPHFCPSWLDHRSCSGLACRCRETVYARCAWDPGG